MKVHMKIYNNIILTEKTSMMNDTSISVDIIIGDFSVFNKMSPPVVCIEFNFIGLSFLANNNDCQCNRRVWNNDSIYGHIHIYTYTWFH